MRTFVLPYKQYSNSAKALATVLNCKRVDGSKIFKPTDAIINWGSSDVPMIRGNPRVINSARAVAAASNKLRTFEILNAAGVATLEGTTSEHHARVWVEDGLTVYCRTIVTGHSGAGIVVASTQDDVVPAPLYTKAILKAHEYRVHVFNGRVIDLKKKRRRNDTESSDYIKNHGHGWVFCRDGVQATVDVYKESIKAVAALGLTFGAVDVLYKEKDNVVAVLEVNTAPGLEGHTLTSYKKAIEEYLCHI